MAAPPTFDRQRFIDQFRAIADLDTLHPDETDDVPSTYGEVLQSGQPKLLTLRLSCLERDKLPNGTKSQVRLVLEDIKGEPRFEIAGSSLNRKTDLERVVALMNAHRSLPDRGLLVYAQRVDGHHLRLWYDTFPDQGGLWGDGSRKCQKGQEQA